MNTRLKDYIEPLKAEATDTVNDIGERLGESVENLTGSGKGFIRSNPWKSLAIIAIAAGVVGYLLSNSDED